MAGRVVGSYLPESKGSTGGPPREGIPPEPFMPNMFKVYLFGQDSSNGRWLLRDVDGW